MKYIAVNKTHSRTSQEHVISVKRINSFIHSFNRLEPRVYKHITLHRRPLVDPSYCQHSLPSGDGSSSFSSLVSPSTFTRLSGSKLKPVPQVLPTKDFRVPYKPDYPRALFQFYAYRFYGTYFLFDIARYIKLTIRHSVWAYVKLYPWSVYLADGRGMGHGCRQLQPTECLSCCAKALPACKKTDNNCTTVTSCTLLHLLAPVSEVCTRPRPGLSRLPLPPRSGPPSLLKFLTTSV